MKMANGQNDMNRAILIVEDDIDLCETFKDVVELEGFRVQTASNGREALSLLNDQPRPALIILDLMMPEMNGWEFLDRLRSHQLHSNVPVVVVTAAQEYTFKGLHADGVLKKPIDLDNLIELIARLLPEGSASNLSTLLTALGVSIH